MVSQTAITAFRTSLRGPSFVLGEPDYDERRKVFNSAIDRSPALIARCAGAADVLACVRFAREHAMGLPSAAAVTASQGRQPAMAD